MVKINALEVKNFKILPLEYEYLVNVHQQIRLSVNGTYEMVNDKH